MNKDIQEFKNVLYKKAALAGLVSGLATNDEGEDAENSDVLINALGTEAGAGLGGTVGFGAGSVLGSLLAPSFSTIYEKPTLAKVLAALAAVSPVAGAATGYGLGGYLTHESLRKGQKKRLESKKGKKSKKEDNE
jgi:membrane protein YqaA with SNARE-associated domain